MDETKRKPTRVELGLDPPPGTFAARLAELECAVEEFKRELNEALGPVGRMLTRAFLPRSWWE